jgi:hypothetical protein
MRVGVIGCGNQGVGFAALMAQEREVESLFLLDYDPRAATRAATAVESLCRRGSAGPSIAAAEANAASLEELSENLRGVDLVLNATLPAFNLPIMQACLVSGSHYLDLYSYPFAGSHVSEEETLGAQTALDPEFREQGLLALPSLGINPGWANLAAREATVGMDEIDSLVLRDIDWFDSNDLLSPVTPEVLMEQWLGEPGSIRTEWGKTVSRDLASSAETYCFPDPVGEQTVLTTTTNLSSLMISAQLERPVRHMEEKFAVISGGLDMRDILLTAVCRQTAKHRSTQNILALFGDSFLETSSLHFGKARLEGLVRDAAYVCSIEAVGRTNRASRRTVLECLATLEETLKRIPWAPPGVLATVAVPVEVALMIERGEIRDAGVVQLADLESGSQVLTGVERLGLRVTQK